MLKTLKHYCHVKLNNDSKFDFGKLIQFKRIPVIS
jgi:hypothetical protein